MKIYAKSTIENNKVGYFTKWLWFFKLLQQNKNWYKDKFLGEPDMFTHFNW